MKNATARPWTYKQNYTSGAGSFIGPDRRGVACVTGNIKRPPEETLANAALILAAVNTFDEARAVIERAATFIGEALIDNGLSEDVKPLHNDLMHVLAKLDGKEAT